MIKLVSVGFFYLVGFGFLWFKILEVSKLNRGIQFFGPNPIEKMHFFVQNQMKFLLQNQLKNAIFKSNQVKNAIYTPKTNKI
jgi:hypothetical protein